MFVKPCGKGLFDFRLSAEVGRLHVRASCVGTIIDVGKDPFNQGKFADTVKFNELALVRLSLLMFVSMPGSVDNLSILCENETASLMTLAIAELLLFRVYESR